MIRVLIIIFSLTLLVGCSQDNYTSEPEDKANNSGYGGGGHGGYGGGH
ncbi:Uncharacterised protein [Legionella beliardensis]|uniref:Lipoprotein n=1 Tax=Legionella beliardensis TaxID=91822 RepID=A0A378JY86_9GAMM|nr:hypothetical protein [Legionella beliardensis]STX55722.1 Uncharacterised protein [Legionella beliardensis]